MDLKVKGKTVFVSGATQGIGMHTALQFAAEGAQVALTYRSQKDKGEEVAAQIEKAGGKALPLFMDMGDNDSIRASIAATTKAFGGIDILINNAVRYQDYGRKGEKFESIAEESWLPVLRHTIEGTYLTIQLVLPHMREKKWGRIVNVSSGIAANGFPGRGTYGAAKSAIHGLTKSLAKEVGGDGILVNCLLPGLVPGERDLEVMSKEIRENAVKNASIKRLLTADEVANAIVYFGSGANTSMTAQIVGVGGS